MASLPEIYRALFGAVRLARLDPGGMTYFDTSVRGFWASFTAAALVLPLYALMLWIRYEQGIEAAPLGRLVPIKGVAFAISWLAFPVVMISLAASLGKWDRYIGFIVAYNWAGALQNGLFMILIALTDLGALPGAIGSTLLLIAFVLVLGYAWFVAKTALDVPGTVAAGIVAMDFMIGMLIDLVADGMLARS